MFHSRLSVVLVEWPLQTLARSFSSYVLRLKMSKRKGKKMEVIFLRNASIFCCLTVLGGGCDWDSSILFNLKKQVLLVTKRSVKIIIVKNICIITVKKIVQKILCSIFEVLLSSAARFGPTLAWLKFLSNSVEFTLSPCLSFRFPFLASTLILDTGTCVFAKSPNSKVLIGRTARDLQVLRLEFLDICKRQFKIYVSSTQLKVKLQIIK